MRLRRPDHRFFGDDFRCQWRRAGSFIGFVQFMIIIVFVCALAMTVGQCARGNVDAHEAALDWASNIPDAVQVTCASRDTDGDGYVSCTVFRQNGEPTFIECGSGIAWNSGCRAPKAVIHRPHY